MKKILFIIALAFVVCLINSTYTYAATNNSEAKLERQIKREKKKIERLRKQSSKEFRKMNKALDEYYRLEEKKGYVLD